MMDTVNRARGRWREVLPALGVETRFLQNKHGPCPLCGGRDRFRWDDRDGSGEIYSQTGFDSAVPGIYSISYEFSDAAGNPAAPISRTIYVSQAYIFLVFSNRSSKP